MKNWNQILTHVKNWYQFITDEKNRYLDTIVTDISNKDVKNWNRMQNAENWGWGAFYQCEEYVLVCYMKFDFVRIFHIV